MVFFMTVSLRGSLDGSLGAVRCGGRFSNNVIGARPHRGSAQRAKARRPARIRQAPRPARAPS